MYILFMLLLLSPTQTIYKCVDDGGIASYSDKPCPGKNELVKSIETNKPKKQKAPEWEFSKHKDDMTGETSCFVGSPSSTVRARRNDSEEIELRVWEQSGTWGAAIYVSNDPGSASFHPDVQGQGVKVGNFGFLEVKKKHKNLLVFGAHESALIANQLRAAPSFRLRMRFWPYDQLIDSDAITTAGFSDAATPNRACF